MPGIASNAPSRVTPTATATNLKFHGAITAWGSQSSGPSVCVGSCSLREQHGGAVESLFESRGRIPR